MEDDVPLPTSTQIHVLSTTTSTRTSSSTSSFMSVSRSTPSQSVPAFPSPSSSSHTLTIALGVACPSLAILILFLIWWFCYRKNHRRPLTDQPSGSLGPTSDIVYTPVDFEDKLSGGGGSIKFPSPQSISGPGTLSPHSGEFGQALFPASPYDGHGQLGALNSAGIMPATTYAVTYPPPLLAPMGQATRPPYPEVQS